MKHLLSVFNLFLHLSLPLSFFFSCSASKVKPENASESLPPLDESTASEVDILPDPPPDSPSPSESSTNTPSAIVPPPPETLPNLVMAESSASASLTEAPPESFPIPASTPESTPQEVSLPVASSPSSKEVWYEIQGTDTLMKIAFEQYGNLYRWKEIYEKNKDKIPHWNQLPKGVKILLEQTENPVVISHQGEKYLIVRGDTLGKISGKVYGTPKKWKRLWDNNRDLIQDRPNQIYSGFYLYYLPETTK